MTCFVPALTIFTVANVICLLPVVFFIGGFHTQARGWQDGVCSITNVGELKSINATCSCDCTCKWIPRNNCTATERYDLHKEDCYNDLLGHTTCETFSVDCAVGAHALCSQCHYWHYQTHLAWSMSSPSLSQPIKWEEVYSRDDSSVELQTIMFQARDCVGGSCKFKSWPCSAWLPKPVHGFASKPPQLSMDSHRHMIAKAKFAMCIIPMATGAITAVIWFIVGAVALQNECKLRYLCCRLCCVRVDDEDSLKSLIRGNPSVQSTSSV